MQRLLVVCALIAGLAACAGNSPSVDAGGGFGAACTTVSDTMSTECTSHVCTNSFDQIGHPVCSERCTFGMDSTCPAGSSGAKCNMKGYCKP
jgi:hypothetical protein